MKTTFNTVLLMLLPVLVWAHGIEEQKHVRQKTVKKAYLVNADAGVDIQNCYGSIYLTTWNEDKIEIEVLIKVSSDSEAWANKKIDDINIDIDALKTLVSAKTVFSNNAGNSRSDNNSIEVNYTVKMPSAGSAKLNNKYGNIITTDLSGSANINCQYGKITLGKLNNANNRIDIQYCSKSSAAFLKAAIIDCDYSGLTVEDFGNVVLKSSYSDLVLKSGNNLKYDSSYGKIVLGEIKNLEGAGDYLTIKADALSGNLKIDTEYSQVNVGMLSAKAGNVWIDSEYTNIDLGFSAQYGFGFDVKVKYGNFRYPGDVEIDSRQETNSAKSFTGHYGKSSNKVTIVSSFGNINLTKK